MTAPDQCCRNVKKLLLIMRTRTSTTSSVLSWKYGRISGRRWQRPKSAAWENRRRYYKNHLILNCKRSEQHSRLFAAREVQADWLLNQPTDHPQNFSCLRYEAPQANFAERRFIAPKIARAQTRAGRLAQFPAPAGTTPSVAERAAMLEWRLASHPLPRSRRTRRHARMQQ